MQKIELIKFDELYRKKMNEYSKDIISTSLLSLSPELIEAVKILRSIIVFLGNAKSGIPGKNNDQIGLRIWLHQIYNQGMIETEKLLLKGQYFKAAVCMKQELEILTRIRQIKKGILPDGKTPNVSFALPGMGKAYGVLNEIGHVSKPEYYKFLDSHEFDNSNNATPFPTFIKAMLVDSYNVYVWFLLEMTKESVLLFRDMFPEDESIFLEVMEHYSETQDILGKNGFHFKEP